MTRINEVLYFVLYDLCKIKKTQNKSASVFSIGTPEWNRTTAAPEADALSTELRAHSVWCTMHHSEL